MSVDSFLWFACTAGEVAVIALLIYRRIWRFFPVFFSYSAWIVVVGAVCYALFRIHFAGYAMAYIVELVGDSALLFGVLVELAWSILRPLRPAPPRRLLLIIIALILAVGAAIWPFCRVSASAGTPARILAIMHVQQTFYILQMLVFVGFAACSQFLSIGWRDRELQIATGLGITAIVSLVVAMLHAYPSMRAQYSHLNRLVVISFVCSIVYWIVSFSQQEEERREFSPQMQAVLLAVAGTARSTRIALSQPGGQGGKAALGQREER